ncbi:hypothetical protein A616_16700 [Brevibacillus brevis X23]|nr:hypothetical protein A616_16700 [Brevibacillus brevis X23]
MPTGYTSRLYEGENVSVEEFISTCARAFGAYIMVRDEPLDKKVPDEFQPSTYNKERLEEARERLNELLSMSLDEAKLKAEEEHQMTLEQKRKQRHEKDILNKKYTDMLTKVKAWQPPSTKHDGLKEFCITQLKDSIKWDCGYILPDPIKQSPEEWLNSKIENTKKDIDYHTNAWNEEVKRTTERNKWIKQLKESLEKLG